MFLNPIAELYTLTRFSLLIILLALISSTNCQACAAGSAKEVLGNWYCSEVEAITYLNWPGYGQYNRITSMDVETGECTSEPYRYSGSLSPMNEELSLHIRGPVSLKQVAIYFPNSIPQSKQKRVDFAHRHIHERRANKHAIHDYLHVRQKKAKKKGGDEAAKRDVGDVVEVSMDGKVVSWVNEYAGTAVSTSAPSPDGQNTAADVVTMTPLSLPHSSIHLAGSPSATGSTYPDIDSGSWTRQAYYNADASIAEGLTFLNHFGGITGIPGTAAGGPAFGASLSYASPDGKHGAASSQILEDIMLEDDIEVILLSDRSCNDSDCGYTRPGGVAYHGFGGPNKVFLLEFSMPLTGATSFNGDMPAIWLENAQIPLTSQYGVNPDCSCWTSGCGEFDIFEVLDHGDMRCKSTLHMAPAGGSSDWFKRPTSETITAAVILAGREERAVIRVLDGAQSFEKSLGDAMVANWIKETSSVFKMGD